MHTFALFKHSHCQILFLKTFDVHLFRARGIAGREPLMTFSVRGVGSWLARGAQGGVGHFSAIHLALAKLLYLTASQSKAWFSSEPNHGAPENFGSLWFVGGVRGLQLVAWSFIISVFHGQGVKSVTSCSGVLRTGAKWGGREGRAVKGKVQKVKGNSNVWGARISVCGYRIWLCGCGHPIPSHPMIPHSEPPGCTGMAWHGMAWGMAGPLLWQPLAAYSLLFIHLLSLAGQNRLSQPFLHLQPTCRGLCVVVTISAINWH